MIGSGTRFLIALSIAGLGYVFSNVFGVMAMNTLTAAHCTTSLFTLTCDYPSPDQWAPGTFEMTALAASVTLAASSLWLRETLSYPFIAMVAVLALLAVGYDGLFGRPIVQEAKIINDTMNVLGFVIFASFFLTFAMVEESVASPLYALAAVVVSFGAKVAAMCTFAALQPHVMGATELFLLFFLYTFGAFSLHLMTVGSLVGRTQPVAHYRDAGNVETTAARNDAVDGLRGVAILLMVIYHFVPTTFFSFSLGKPINSILFVVAGYFFASTLLNNADALNKSLADRVRSTADILLRRHLRIWPVLAIVVGLYAVLALVDGGPLTQQIFATWPYYLGYLGYVPRWTYEDQTFPPHLWVVSAQEGLIFLCCIASAISGIARLRQNLWALVCLGIAFRFIGTTLFMPNYPSLALETPLAVLDPLALGMLARFQFDRRGAAFQLRQVLTLILLSAIALWISLPNWNTVYFTLVPLIVALMTALVMVVSADQIRGARLAAAGLAHPVLVTIGRMSLSAFLLHPLVSTCIRLVYAQYSGEVMAWWLLLAVGPPASFAVAWAFWRMIEEPLRRIKSRRVVNRAVPESQAMPSRTVRGVTSGEFRTFQRSFPLREKTVFPPATLGT